MTREQIRYSMQRVKSENCDKEHQAVFDSYKSQLDEFELTIKEFTIEWDIDKNKPFAIVTGRPVRKLNKELSLFGSDGKLKE